MGKLVKKYLLVFLLSAVTVGIVYAAATKFTDLQCRNMTVTGTLGVTGVTTLGAGVVPYARTLAQLATTTVTAGGLVYVSDGVMTKLCQSSGTVGGFTLLQSTAPTAALTNQLMHCQ